MPPIRNLEGQRFGRLRVLHLTARRNGGHRGVIWLCLCDCGQTKPVPSNSLRGGHTKSCGCWQKESARTKHLLRPYESYYNFLVSVQKHRRKQIPVILTYEEFVSLLQTKRCHYCWTPLSWEVCNRNRVKGGSSYKLDRKDSNKGYTNDNCVVCCGRCNRGKCDLFTYDEWRAMTAVCRNGELSNGVETNSTEGNEDGVGGGSPATDSSIGGVAGEAQDIGGISSDPSVATESPVDEGSTEGLGTGLSSL
jgi:hypothetical protein